MNRVTVTNNTLHSKPPSLTKSLLRYNSYTIKVTHLKLPASMRIHSVFIGLYNHPHNLRGEIFHPSLLRQNKQINKLTAFSNHSPRCPPLSRLWQPFTSFLSPEIRLFGTYFLELKSHTKTSFTFTQHNVSKVHPCCNNMSIRSFYCQIIFHHM